MHVFESFNSGKKQQKKHGRREPLLPVHKFGKGGNFNSYVIITTYQKVLVEPLLAGSDHKQCFSPLKSTLGLWTVYVATRFRAIASQNFPFDSLASKIKSLLFVDYVALLASSDCDLMLLLEQLKAKQLRWKRASPNSLYLEKGTLSGSVMRSCLRWRSVSILWSC